MLLAALDLDKTNTTKLHQHMDQLGVCPNLT